MAGYCPELKARVQTFQQQIQEFQHYLEQDLGGNQPLIERSLKTVLAQLETLLDSNAAVPGFSQPNEAQWSALSACLPFGIFSTDLEGRCTYVNSRYAEMLGDPINQTLGEGWHELIHPEERDRVLLTWAEAVKLGICYVNQFRILTAQGDLRWVSIRTTPIISQLGELSGHTGTIEDITSQRLAEEQIKRSLQEKEALLKEIHHRVKNNLQIISSLIYLQAQRISDPKLRQIFEDSQSRIGAMALVHDALYRSQDFACINLSEYVQTLTLRLFHTYCTQPDIVRLSVQIEPDIVVSLEKAIPCGLILNELMTNALKHGFSGEETGEVVVILESHSPQLCLTVENSGKNLPESFELDKIRSMGLQLVSALTSQISGKFTVEHHQKTRFNVMFNAA